MPGDVEKLAAELRAGLDGVTPGPWFASDVTEDDWGFDYATLGPFESTNPHYESSIVEVTGENKPSGACGSDANHIARCSPENILAVLDELDRLTAENAKLRERTESIERDTLERVTKAVRSLSTQSENGGAG